MRVILFLICFIFNFAGIVFYTTLLIIVTRWLIFYFNQPGYEDSYIKNYENI